MELRIWSGAAVVVLGVLYHYDWLYIVGTVVAYLGIAGLGIYLGVSWSLVRGKQYRPASIPQELEYRKATQVIQDIMEMRAKQKPEPKKVVLSRNLDLALQEVVDLTLRDFILSWYKDLSLEQDPLLACLQTDLWMVIENIGNRLSKIDMVPFVTQDVVHRLHEHFRDIRKASKRDKEAESSPQSFMLHPWLKSSEEEVKFLRRVSEALLIIILPKHFSRSTPIRHLLREVLTNTVLKPMVDLICDPDYINTKLISYIEYREKLSEDTRRTYTYAATYEDFVKMIEKCEDIEHLKQMRFNIMTEIMQATTINNLKKSQDKPGSPKGNKSTAKGELLKARNLKRYINQLTVAKARCEKRIHYLGGPDYKYYTADDGEEAKKVTILPGQKVLEFKKIMGSSTAREYFETFLKRDDNDSLIGFWNGVERLREVDKRGQHQLASEIYQLYISSTTSVVRVEKPTAKRMESFLLGDTGPDAFFEAQESVCKILEEQYYPSFLVSDVYHRYITSLDDDSKDASQTTAKDELFFKPKEEWVESDEEEAEMFATQAYHAQQKLQQLDAKITNKSQALQALRTSHRLDTKVRKVEEDLEKEVECMKLERRTLESHIQRTVMWCENQGKWRAHIYEAEIGHTEGDKKVPLFVIVIHLSGSGTSQNLQNSTQGWVVTRRLQDFISVHEKLVQIGPWLRKKKLPSLGTFTTIDDKYMKEAKASLNEYLSTVMKDERMAQSEALYGFLTPTPEYFQQPTQKKSSFFLKNFLKSIPSIGQDNRENDDELLFGLDDGTKEDRSKDSIAEPLYGLINEVYELQGMFKWLRKTFIAFVEATFGRSINRQLRETVYWIFSEPMIIYYIRTFKDSMWPNGCLAEPLPVQTKEEKLQTRMKAKDKFLKNQPDAVKNLVGEDNARRGAIKMFEVLQDVRLNKHIFYVLLELLLMDMCPELQMAVKTPDEHVLISSNSLEV